MSVEERKRSVKQSNNQYHNFVLYLKHIRIYKEKIVHTS